jgi:hypothetical protein
MRVKSRIVVTMESVQVEKIFTIIGQVKMAMMYVYWNCLMILRNIIILSY